MKSERDWPHGFAWSCIFFSGCLSTFVTYWMLAFDIHRLMDKWRTFRIIVDVLRLWYDVSQYETGLWLFISVETCFKQLTWQPIIWENRFNRLTSWMKDESCVYYWSAALNIRLMIRSNCGYWWLVTPCCILDWEPVGLYHGWVPCILTPVVGACTVDTCYRAGFKSANMVLTSLLTYGDSAVVYLTRLGYHGDTQHQIVFCCVPHFHVDIQFKLLWNNLTKTKSCINVV